MHINTTRMTRDNVFTLYLVLWVYAGCSDTIITLYTSDQKNSRDNEANPSCTIYINH